MNKDFLREANYISDARETLEESLIEQGENPKDWGDNWEELLDLYTLLLDVKGESVTLEDIHTAFKCMTQLVYIEDTRSHFDKAKTGTSQYTFN